jgi:drug/metabolite transporter (DMT)-like permease
MAEKGARAGVKRATAALLGVALIWGHNVPLMKLALAEMHPFAFNAARLSLSAILLGALAAAEARRAPPPPLRRATRWRVLAVGLLGGLVYQAVFISGAARTTAGNVGIIIASGPLWTALLARVAGVERTTMRGWAGLGVAFAGTALVTLEGGAVDLGGTTLRGNLLVLAGAMTWAGSTVMSKGLIREVSPTRLAYLTTLWMMPLHLLLGAPHLGQLQHASAVAWGCVAYSGLLSTGLAYALWNLGIRHVGPSRTAVFTNLVPVITLASSTWMLGESITAWQIGGGALVLGGLLAMRR